MRNLILLSALVVSFIAPCVRADEVRFLAHAPQAFSEFLALANSAKTSIDIATYIFEPCHASTQVLLEILEKKAKEGVHIRILLDVTMQPSEQKQNLNNYFASHGMEVRFYNNFEIVNPGANLRMHTKIFIVDGRSFISGGRNISDEYFNMSSLQNWLDRDAMVTGPSTSQAVSAFNELWASDMVSSIDPDPTAFVDWAKFCPGGLSRVAEVKNYFDAHGPALIASIPVRACKSVSFVNDNPDFGSGQYSDGDAYMNPIRLRQKRTTNALLKFVSGAQKRLVMENWGYIPIDLLDNALTDRRDHHVEITTITNLDMDGDPAFIRQAVEYATETYGERDSDGSEIVKQVSSREKIADGFELTPAGARFMIHSKTFVRDGKDAAVASFNLDPRSFATNVEAAVIVKNCPDFAADVAAPINDLEKIYETDKAAGTLPQIEQISEFAKIFSYVSLMLL